MNTARPFALSSWVKGEAKGASQILAGSAAPPLSLEDLISLSTDPEATKNALDFRDLKLGLGSEEGNVELRSNIAANYDQTDVHLTEEDVVVANGTTGANLLAFEALISPGDHVVCMYPIYGPLIDIPKALGAQVSFWKLDYENGWKPDVEQLKSLITPSTKMIILNSPNNPTGFVLSTELQRKVIDIASAENIILFVDEIFRPLFHIDSHETKPKSMVEHGNYDNVVVTGSLSKCWGLSGVRIGWVVSRNTRIRNAVLGVRQYILESVSAIDEKVGKEALSSRCNQNIVNKYLDNARMNLVALDDFIARHKQEASYHKQVGGATVFLRFTHPGTGAPLDDLELCRKLKREVGVLLSPGQTTFGATQNEDFKGFVRIHLTAVPDTFKGALESIERFLASGAFGKS